MATDTKQEEHKSVDTAKVEKDSKFQFGPAPIQTAEDAALAYLREEISEDEFRAACSKFGVLPGTLLQSGKNARIDASFKRQIPDDIYDAATAPDVTLEDKLKAVEEKEKAKKKAADDDEDAKLKNKEHKELPVGNR